MVKVSIGFQQVGRLIAVVLSMTLFKTAILKTAIANDVQASSETKERQIVAAEDELSTGNNIFSCPEDVKTLTSLLLQDLPSYGNRVIQRTQDINQAAKIENYLITASEAEFEPLDLPRIEYNQIDQADPEQVFFTVLERQYINNKIVEIQTYHWLFLTQTDSGWHTVILFSRFGNSNGDRPPAPPRETTNGIIGQGVQLWLRDCRAGAIRREFDKS